MSKGAPMSKSLGNIVLPNEICEKWGADLLRLWVASQDYTADVRMSDSDDDAALPKLIARFATRSASRCANLADFDPARDAVPDAELEEIDRWMLARTGGSGEAVPRVVRELRISSRLSCDARFLRRGSERVLFRRAEGSALYVCAAEQIAALGADGGLEDHQRVDPIDDADPSVHGRRTVEVFAESNWLSQTAFILRFSRPRRNCGPTCLRTEPRFGSCLGKCAAKF